MKWRAWLLDDCPAAAWRVLSKGDGETGGLGVRPCIDDPDTRRTALQLDGLPDAEVLEEIALRRQGESGHCTGTAMRVSVCNLLLQTEFDIADSGFLTIDEELPGMERTGAASRSMLVIQDLILTLALQRNAHRDRIADDVEHR